MGKVYSFLRFSMFGAREEAALNERMVDAEFVSMCNFAGGVIILIREEEPAKPEPVPIAPFKILDAQLEKD